MTALRQIARHMPRLFAAHIPVLLGVLAGGLMIRGEIAAIPLVFVALWLSTRHITE